MLTFPSIEGTWTPVRAELAGEAAPDMVLERTRLVLRAGSYRVEFAGEVADEGSYALETSELNTFPVLLLAGRSGTNAGRGIPCIFQVNGNRLRICYGLDGVLPRAFTTATGDQRYLVTYRRET